MEAIAQRNDTTSIVTNIIIGSLVFFIFLRIITIIRVTRDIKARTSSMALQMFCIRLVTLFTPLLGLPLYFIVRPVYYKHNRQETL